MKRQITIADAHSENNPKQKVIVDLQGGAPWFGYIWINDECYTVVEGARTVKIKKTRV